MAALTGSKDRVVVDSPDVFPTAAGMAKLAFARMSYVIGRRGAGTNSGTVAVAGTALSRRTGKNVLQVTAVTGNFGMGKIEWKKGVLVVEALSGCVTDKTE